MVSTPQIPPRNDERQSTQSEQVPPPSSDRARQVTELQGSLRAPSVGLSNDASLACHAGPPSCPPLCLGQMDGGAAIPRDLQNIIHGEIGTEEYQAITDRELDKLLIPHGYDGIPGMKPGTQLRWHQKVFLIFVLTRLFHGSNDKRWGGLALFDSPGLGKTASVLALQAILGAELQFQHRNAIDRSRLTPLLGPYLESLTNQFTNRISTSHYRRSPLVSGNG